MKKIDTEIIQRFIEGRCSEVEKNEVESWLNSSEENKKEFEAVKRLWSVPPLPVPEPDIEGALLRVKRRIELNAAKIKAEKQTHFISLWEIIERYLFNPAYLKAAAAIVFVFAFYFIFNNITEPEVNEVLVGRSEIAELVLPDGSRIKLDSGSRFNYPEEFSGKIRGVYLSGEGFFEIMHDPQRPFVITTDAGSVTVLGTKFNLRTWESRSEVIVVEGSVSLAPESNANKKNIVIVEAGYKSSIEQNGTPSEPVAVDADEEISWQNREIAFEAVPLATVLSQLERWYNLDIKLPAEEYYNDSVTVYLENKPVEDILDMLSVVSNFKYTMTGNQVIFSVQ